MRWLSLRAGLPPRPAVRRIAGQFARSAAVCLAFDLATAAALRRDRSRPGELHRLPGLSVLPPVGGPATPLFAAAVLAAALPDTPLPLRVALPIHITACALAGLLSTFVLDCSSRCRGTVWQPVRGWEEAPLTGRQRLAPLAGLMMPLGSWVCRRVFFQLPWLCRIGPGAQFYPPDHPKARAAEALRDELLAAAAALVEETHGANSSVARRFRRQLPGFAAAPVRVFSSKDPRMGGFSYFGGFAVFEESSNFTLAHELSHLLLRHPVEAGWAVICSPPVLWTLASDACFRFCTRGPVATVHELLSCVRFVYLARRKAAGGSTHSAPLLQPSHPRFFTCPNIQVQHELEADRIALMLLARAGHDPRRKVQQRWRATNGGVQYIVVRDGSGPLAPEAAQQLVAERTIEEELLDFVDACPEPLASIDCSDRIGGTVWPNARKQARNLLEALPAAERVYAVARLRGAASGAAGAAARDG